MGGLRERLGMISGHQGPVFQESRFIRVLLIFLTVLGYIHAERVRDCRYGVGMLIIGGKVGEISVKRRKIP